MKKTPSSQNNQFGITGAFPGLCSYCYSEVANFNGSKEVLPGVFRPIIQTLKPNYRECLFELSDGTKMTIVLCEACDDDIEPQHMGELMESEIAGWQREMDELCPDWKNEKKTLYMQEQSAKFISDRKTKPWTISQLTKLTKPNANKIDKNKKGKK